jgi:hypothetical protein
VKNSLTGIREGTKIILAHPPRAEGVTKLLITNSFSVKTAFQSKGVLRFRRLQTSEAFFEEPKMKSMFASTSSTTSRPQVQSASLFCGVEQLAGNNDAGSLYPMPEKLMRRFLT